MAVQSIIWIFIAIFSITAIITLLGITNVIKGIRENYLNKLFYTLIIEVIIAVVAVFKGVDFNQQEGAVSISQLLDKAGIEKQFEDKDQEEAYLLSQLRASIEIPTLQNSVKTKEGKIKNLNTEIDSLKTELEDCGEEVGAFENTFFSKIVKLRAMITKYSGSINLKYEPENKKEVFDLLESIFEILGTLENGDSGNIKALQKQYKNFEKRHGLHEDGKLMIIEYETSVLIREYLNKVSPIS